MTVYRLFLHPLKQYPGPIMASLSKLYHAWHARNGQQYLFLERLHLEYGDFVRTGERTDFHYSMTSVLTQCLGPNEVTIFTRKGVAAVYGPKSKCTKSSSYEMMYPLLSLFSPDPKQVTLRDVAIGNQALALGVSQRKDEPVLLGPGNNRINT